VIALQAGFPFLAAGFRPEWAHRRVADVRDLSETASPPETRNPGRASPGPVWRDAPRLARQLTPAHVPPGTYTVSTTDWTLDQVLEGIRPDPALSGPSGGWAVRVMSPFDAFGQGGGYDRWKVARLYGGTPARVARGPRLEDGRVVEAWTLVSPFPDDSLQRLNPGTLRIVMRVR